MNTCEKHGWMDRNPDAKGCPMCSIESASSPCSEDEKSEAILQDRFGPKVRPLAYACHLPRIAAKAREFGYAIAVHGSLQRDMDLIAVPWSEEATDAEQLVQAICETTGAFILQWQDGTKKPHGRIAYILQMGAGLYIDLGVMPRNPPNNALSNSHENKPQ